MGKSAVYFFAESTMDYALWAGMADIIREVKPELPLVLIHADDPTIRDYDWGPILDRFDRVERVGGARYEGDWSVSGILRAWRRGFRQARKVATELEKIEFVPNSVAFVYSGLSLNQAIFLKRTQSDPAVESALLTIQVPERLIDDFVPMYDRSFFLNLYLNYFGTGYLDVHGFRTPIGVMPSQLDIRHRTKPADYVFKCDLPYWYSSLRPGSVYCPLYSVERSRPSTEKAVLLLGTIIEWDRYLSVSVDAWHRRFNELIDVIRTKHAGARLIFKPHPRESEAQRSRLDLSGFEVAPSVSAELLVAQDRSISIAYAFDSVAAHTLLCYGVRSHLLYHLFNDECVPGPVKRFYDIYLRSIHPEMFIRSVDGWMSGQYDYEPVDMSRQIRASAIGTLEAVGVLAEREELALGHNGAAAIPEGRWMPMPRVRSLKGLLWRAFIRLSLYVMLTRPKRVLERIYWRAVKSPRS